MEFFERSFLPIIIAFASFFIIYLIRKLINRNAHKDANAVDEINEEEKSIDDRPN